MKTIKCRECNADMRIDTANRIKAIVRIPEKKAHSYVIKEEDLTLTTIKCETCQTSNCVQVDNEDSLRILKNILIVVRKAKKEKRSKKKADYLKELHQLNDALEKKRKELESNYKGQQAHTDTGELIVLEARKVEV